jgi:hypothetical protein
MPVRDWKEKEDETLARVGIRIHRMDGKVLERRGHPFAPTAARLAGTGARNHGQFVSCVAHLLNSLKSDGRITGGEKGALQSCAARS